MLEVNVLLIISMNRLKHLLQISAVSGYCKQIYQLNDPAPLFILFIQTCWMNCKPEKIKSRLKSKLTTPNIYWQLSILDLKQ